MKKITLLFLFCVAITSFAQNVIFNDPAFKTALLNNTSINTDTDANNISLIEAQAFTGSISVNGLGITDLTGIEAFINITQLSCGFNSLTSLNVSTNIALTILYCNDNNLTSLDVSANVALTTLYCNDNNLNNLIVSNGNNSIIDFFDATNNINLSCIEIDANFTPTVPSGFDPRGWLKDTTASYSTSCIVYIPDANFKASLLNDTAINTVNDGEISVAEAQAFTGTIYAGSLSIADATGLEAFTEIEGLQIQGNSLTTLDISANTKLKSVSCNSNNITNLVLGTNNALTTLNTGTNDFTTLDISGLSALQNLEASFCANLTGLSLTDNVVLKDLNISNCGNISVLDTSANINLEELNVGYCNLFSLDVSSNTSLKILNCINNNLFNLNVKNTNNSSMTSLSVLPFQATGNSNLACILVDDVTYANTNWSTFKDATATFNDVACEEFVYIPDANLKPNLLALADLDADGEITVTEAQAYTGVINLFGVFTTNKITDITGLEAFTEITSFICTHHEVTTADFSNNTKLEVITIDNNELTSLNVTGLTSLETLICYGNSLPSIDVTSNVNLTRLSISGNEISSLDVTQNAALKILIYQGSTNSKLSTLDITNNTVLESLNCSNNELTSLDVTQNIALISLEVSNNQIGSIDVTNNVALTNLEVGSNGLSNLDVTQNTALTTLFFRNNQIGTINLTNCTALEHLTCDKNNLMTLDISNNTALISLDVSDNSLTTLDISNKTILSNLFVDNNDLTSLNIANGNNSNFLNGHLQDNINLTCIQVDDVTVANTKFIKDATASYSTTSCNTVQYTLLTSATNGTITASPANATYASGTVVQLTASPVVGYQFTGWSGDASGITNPLSVTMDAAKNITATFSLVPPTVYYRLTTSATNGTIVPSSTATSNGYVSGTRISLTATPDAGYQFDGWSGDASGVTNPLSVTMTSAKNITATFSLVQHTLTSTATNGSIGVDVQPVNGTYDYGTIVELTATPDAGYQFDGWSGDASGVTNPLAVAINSDTTISALFSAVLGTDAIFNKTINIYPNPIINILNVSLSTGEILESVEVYTLLGKKVLEVTSSSIDFSDVASGVYVLKIENAEGKIAVRKIIKK